MHFNFFFLGRNFTYIKPIYKVSQDSAESTVKFSFCCLIYKFVLKSPLHRAIKCSRKKTKKNTPHPTVWCNQMGTVFVVLGSFNMSYRDEEIILEQKYEKQISWDLHIKDKVSLSGSSRPSAGTSNPNPSLKRVPTRQKIFQN